jgi:hypothetical protein
VVNHPPWLPIANPQGWRVIEPLIIQPADRVRSLEKETPFWRAFGAWFDFKPVLCRQQRPDLSRQEAGGFDGSWRRVGYGLEDTTFLFTARRRPETLGRPVPEADSTLLAKHLDDTLESLLMAELGGVFDDDC